MRGWRRREQLVEILERVRVDALVPQRLVQAATVKCWPTCGASSARVRRPVAAGEHCRQIADLARVAARALVRTALHDQAAAKPAAEVDVEERRVLLARAVPPFTNGRRGCVVLEEHGRVEALLRASSRGECDASRETPSG